VVIENTDHERAVLQVMHDKGVWYPNHKQIVTITHSGFPSDKRGQVSNAIYRLIKKNWILYYNRSKNAICLNPSFRTEILQNILENH